MTKDCFIHLIPIDIYSNKEKNTEKPEKNEKSKKQKEFNKI